MTGWLLVTFGPRVAFGDHGRGPGVRRAAVPAHARREGRAAIDRQSLRAALPGALLFAADGWIAASYGFVWQIALFLSLRESLLGFGGALAVAALVGAVGGLLLGRHIDRGYGKHAVWYAFAPLAVVVVLRALAVGNALFAVVANALGALAGCLYTPTLMTAVYTQGKHAPCTLRFHVVAEGGWDIGGASGLLDRGAARHARRAAMGRHPAGALRHRGNGRDAAPLLRRARVAAKAEASAATPP